MLVFGLNSTDLGVSIAAGNLFNHCILIGINPVSHNYI